MSVALQTASFSSNTGELRWQNLYRIAAIAAFISVGLFLFQLLAFFLWPPPSTVLGLFTLLQTRPFVGLVSLDFVIIVDEVLAIPICLAFYLCLHRTQESLVLLATALSGASISCFLVGTPSLTMLNLSQKYAVAATSAERDAILAAGQSALATWLGTPCQVGYVLGTLGMLLVSIVMLQSPIFSKTAGYLGIAASIVGLGLYVPKVGLYISLVSIVLMQIWYVIVAFALLALVRLMRSTDAGN